MAFQLDIITPEKTLFSARAELVTAPGTLGDFGVLEGHAPFISSLRPGVIEVEVAGEPKLRIAVTEGLAEVNPERCVILAEVAQPLDDLTIAEAKAELRTAEEAVADAITPEQQTAAEKRLALAQVVAEAF